MWQSSVLWYVSFNLLTCTPGAERPRPLRWLLKYTWIKVLAMRCFKTEFRTTNIHVHRMDCQQGLAGRDKMGWGNVNIPLNMHTWTGNLHWDGSEEPILYLL